MRLFLIILTLRSEKLGIKPKFFFNKKHKNIFKNVFQLIKFSNPQFNFNSLIYKQLQLIVVND